MDADGHPYHFRENQILGGIAQDIILITGLGVSEFQYPLDTGSLFTIASNYMQPSRQGNLGPLSGPRSVGGRCTKT